MKKILIALVVLLIIPSILHAEESYFLACKDVKITVNNTDLVSLHNAGIIDSQDENITIPFKKGNLFLVVGGGGRVKTVNSNEHMGSYFKYKGRLQQFRSKCWSDSGEPVSPSPLSRQKTWSLKVHSMPARLKVKFFFRMMSSSGTGVIHSHLGAALPRSMAERWLWVTPPLPIVC